MLKYIQRHFEHEFGFLFKSITFCILLHIDYIIREIQTLKIIILMILISVILRHQNTKETNVKYSRKENKYVDNELCGP